MIAASFLLAAAEVDNNTMFIGLLVVGLTALVNLALGLKQLLVRTPPIESEFATKEELKTHVEENRRDHENIFSKLGGTERGWRDQLTKLSNTVSAVDERSKSTESTVRIMNQNLIDFMHKGGK